MAVAQKRWKFSPKLKPFKSEKNNDELDVLILNERLSCVTVGEHTADGGGPARRANNVQIINADVHHNAVGGRCRQGADSGNDLCKENHQAGATRTIRDRDDVAKSPSCGAAREQATALCSRSRSGDVELHQHGRGTGGAGVPIASRVGGNVLPRVEDIPQEEPRDVVGVRTKPETETVLEEEIQQVPDSTNRSTTAPVVTSSRSTDFTYKPLTSSHSSRSLKKTARRKAKRKKIRRRAVKTLRTTWKWLKRGMVSFSAASTLVPFPMAAPPTSAMPSL